MRSRQGKPGCVVARPLWGMGFVPEVEASRPLKKFFCYCLVDLVPEDSKREQVCAEGGVFGVQEEAY